jgi:hypothetical protein
MSMRMAKTAVLFTLVSVAAWAQVNVGEQKPVHGELLKPMALLGFDSMP